MDALCRGYGHDGPPHDASAALIANRAAPTGRPCPTTSLCGGDARVEVTDHLIPDRHERLQAVPEVLVLCANAAGKRGTTSSAPRYRTWWKIPSWIWTPSVPSRWAGAHPADAGIHHVVGGAVVRAQLGVQFLRSIEVWHVTSKIGGIEQRSHPSHCRI